MDFQPKHGATVFTEKATPAVLKEKSVESVSPLSSDLGGFSTLKSLSPEIPLRMFS